MQTSVHIPFRGVKINSKVQYENFFLDVISLIKMLVLFLNKGSASVFTRLKYKRIEGSERNVTVLYCLRW